MSQKFGDSIVCPGLRHVGVTTGATEVTTTSTSYVGLGSDDLSVTLPYPASGVATITIRADLYASVINILALMTFEVRDTNASGTVRLATNDANSIKALSKVANESLATCSLSYVATGLPTSGTMFVRGMYRSNGAATAKFLYRGLTVAPSL